MFYALLICAVVLFMCFRDIRALLKSVILWPRALPWACRDLFLYIKNKEYKKCKLYGIFMFGGLFGTGKTFNIVDFVYKLFRRYTNIEVVSNIHLENIPYTPFRYFEQLKDKPHKEGNVVVYVIDELGSLMNSRNYKDNKISETEYIATLMQIRKEHKLLLISTQRFSMVDKMFRQVCDTWYECKRFWRFFWRYPYDPEDLEYSLDPRTIKPCCILPKMVFATNEKYARYNTNEVVKPFDNVLEVTGRADTSNGMEYRYGPGSKRKYYRR